MVIITDMQTHAHTHTSEHPHTLLLTDKYLSPSSEIPRGSSSSFSVAVAEGRPWSKFARTVCDSSIHTADSWRGPKDMHNHRLCKSDLRRHMVYWPAASTLNTHIYFYSFNMRHCKTKYKIRSCNCTQTNNLHHLHSYRRQSKTTSLGHEIQRVQTQPPINNWNVLFCLKPTLLFSVSLSPHVYQYLCHLLTMG